MKPLRPNRAIAIDGGGIKGVVAARALSALEEYLGIESRKIFDLAAGTSTGAILAAGIGAGLTGAAMHRLYTHLGPAIFKRSWRTWLWPLSRYRYRHEPLERALRQFLGAGVMGDFWDGDAPIDVVMTTFDVVENRTRFIKPWKETYASWPIVKSVLASSSVPTTFPPVEGRYVDGGVGAYANPCYVAAYEARFVLDWDPRDTTLISLGTGRSPHTMDPDDARGMWPWQWLQPVLGAFMQSADDQQVHLVDTFFEGLDFRRFQVDLREPIGMDDVSKMADLTAYGDTLGQMILDDVVDRTVEITPLRPRSRR